MNKEKPKNCLECKFCYTNENGNNFCCGRDEAEEGKKNSDDMGNNITACNDGVKKND
jgi:hypothetical protein